MKNCSFYRVYLPYSLTSNWISPLMQMGLACRKPIYMPCLLTRKLHFDMPLVSDSGKIKTNQYTLRGGRRRKSVMNTIRYIHWSETRMTLLWEIHSMKHLGFLLIIVSTIFFQETCANFKYFVYSSL